MQMKLSWSCKRHGPRPFFELIGFVGEIWTSISTCCKWSDYGWTKFLRRVMTGSAVYQVLKMRVGKRYQMRFSWYDSSRWNFIDEVFMDMEVGLVFNLDTQGFLVVLSNTRIKYCKWWCVLEPGVLERCFIQGFCTIGPRVIPRKEFVYRCSVMYVIGWMVILDSYKVQIQTELLHCLIHLVYTEGDIWFFIRKWFFGSYEFDQHP